MKQQKKKKIKKKLIIFDIDGVLIDVSRSYRIAIKKTAEFFLGRILDLKEIDEVKDSGVNNDYDAAERIIEKYGGSFRKQSIIKKFQEYYLGRNFMGLVGNEKLIISEDMIKKLRKKYKLAIFTGRPKPEADYALKRFKINKYFKTIVALEDVQEQKPNPEGLLKILKKAKVKKEEAIYVGDNPADLAASKEAGIDFIGFLPVQSQASKNILKDNGAEIIITQPAKLVGAIK